MKLTTCFILKTKQIYTKTLTVSESTFKIKLMSAWTLFSKFCLRQQFFANKDFYTNKRFCNIFKTTNTKKLIKAISESSSKFLQTPWKKTTLKQPIHFSRAAFSYFLHLNYYKFHTALTKSIKLHLNPFNPGILWKVDI